ncbi:branched-chain amino acid ABC transporter permease [Intestinimonas massiliensis (ex Afouda et al. 2020)]|uniref:branched-chain amino acid ABC transporter permease n=1 Tax=Intestinimonas massiliensis (ex Afouda et al. 2020) TaxID=1673721 RepID=UPI00103126C2|nr:branched-chain amino acid ABC transporter permease [Intestinimonas massiliensis (ex Afouda et al. 2020)]
MSSYYVGLVIQACISIIAVTGIFALTGLAGMFSLGQAAYMAVGAYVTFILAANTGLPFWITSLGGIATCALVAWVAALPTVRMRKDYFSLISVGLGQAITALLITFSDITNGSQGYSKIPKVEHLMPLAILLVVLVVFCIRNLKYSRFGRMCIALKTDELAAKSFGINVYQLKIKIYILASIVASLAGILYGLQNRVLLPESFGWTASSEQEIFLFFGGTNSLTGAVFSAAFLKCLPEIFRNVTLFGQSLQEYRTIIYCILILLIINFRPTGLLGERELSLGALRKRFSRGKSSKVKGGKKHE